MLFNSLSFLIFLPIVLCTYWALSASVKWQNRWLLVASYFFYGWWDWRYLFLIAGCSLINFYSGLVIGTTTRRWLKVALLSCCCIVSLGVLGLFKYYNFFIESFASLCSCFGIHWSPLILQIALPVGISFFTFQAMSYTFDVFYGKLKPTRSVVDFLAFISFFPQLVAGPIERATNLLPQFQRSRTFDPQNALHGITLIVYGLFKKVVVADALSSYVDAAFEKFAFYDNSLTCLIAAFFFSIQIYCDFSGYSDTARGIAKLFGFELMLNFNRPYLSKSFTEFWRRWHISLSTWFKDYLYIPLGGNRVTPAKMLRNLWIVFLISGLWHGANWTFIAWGALHAVYQTVAFLRNRYLHFSVQQRWYWSVVQIVSLNVGVIFAWIFFRATSIAQALDFIQMIAKCDFSCSMSALCAGSTPFAFLFRWWVIALLGITYLTPKDAKFETSKGYLAFILFLIFSIIVFGQAAGGEFIYFQF